MIPTLPRDAYVADRVWDDERERIFAHQWLVVGRIDDVAAPGDYLRAAVAGPACAPRPRAPPGSCEPAVLGAERLESATRRAQIGC